MRAIDLDNLTPLQDRVAREFLAALLLGKRVCFQDFPDMDQDEFEQLADAIVVALQWRH